MNCQKKLDELLLEIFNLEIDENMKDKSLFGEPFNMKARNFLILFLEIEERFNIKFSNQAIEKMDNVSYNGLVSEIEKARLSNNT